MTQKWLFIIIGSIAISFGIGYLDYLRDKPTAIYLTGNVVPSSYPSQAETDECQKTVIQTAEDEGIEFHPKKRIKTTNIRGSELAQVYLGIVYAQCSAPTSYKLENAHYEQRALKFTEALSLPKT